jgi:hypothetical protein
MWGELSVEENGKELLKSAIGGEYHLTSRATII